MPLAEPFAPKNLTESNPLRTISSRLIGSARSSLCVFPCNCCNSQREQKKTSYPHTQTHYSNKNMSSSSTQQQQNLLLIPKHKQEEEEEDQVVEEEEYDEEAAQQQQQQVLISPEEDLISAVTAAAATPPTATLNGSAAGDESRRLFQRLWTDEDEIKLLQGFLDYTSQRSSHNNNNNNNINSSSSSSASSYHHDTALFYEQIKNRFQLGFNKNQLVEKLRRLKKKYRNVVNRISSGKDVSFKSPHDQAAFEISRKIWSTEDAGPAAAAGPAAEDDDQKKPNFVEIKPEDVVLDGRNSTDQKVSSSRKRSRSRDGAQPESMPSNRSDSCGLNGGVEDTVLSCVSPLFKELLCCTSNTWPSSSNSGEFGILGLLNPLAINLSSKGDLVVEEKWRKQRVLELEVYSKRVELVQEQVKLALEELRSNNG